MEGPWTKWGVLIATGSLVLTYIATASQLHWPPFTLHPTTSQTPPPGSNPTQPPPSSSPATASAQISLSRPTAPRGSSLTVYGSGFRPNELVQIMIQDTFVANVTADSQGQFTQDITIPNSAPPAGVQTSIVATGEMLDTATAPFSTS
jgi:hypothetical protein